MATEIGAMPVSRVPGSLAISAAPPLAGVVRDREVQIQVLDTGLVTGFSETWRHRDGHRRR